MTEEIPTDERKQLESKINDAINKGCSINFDSKDFNMHQIKYMQKYAEIDLFNLDVNLTGILLLIAVGGSYVLTFSFTIYTFSFLGLIMAVLGFYLLLYYWMPRYKRCKKIILDVEWQIQTPSEDKEKE